MNMDELHATKLYLRHQLSIRPEHRVLQIPEDEAEQQLISINLNLTQYASALEDLVDQQPPI